MKYEVMKKVQQVVEVEVVDKVVRPSDVYSTKINIQKLLDRGYKIVGFGPVGDNEWGIMDTGYIIQPGTFWSSPRPARFIVEKVTPGISLDDAWE